MAYNVNDARIVGLKLSVAGDGVTVSLSPGAAYIPNQGRALLQADMSVVVTGVTSAWRHFYLGNDNGTLAFEYSATAPADPYQGTARTKSNDATRRYLGSLYFNASGVTLAFLHTQVGDRANRISFTPPGGAAIAQSRLLNIATGTTPTLVDASAVVPMTCRLMYTLINNTSTSDAYLGTPDGGTLSTTNYLLFVKANQAGQFDVEVNGNQLLNYFLNGIITLGGLTIQVRGYLFDR
jgi:hypothetical protein